MIPFKTSLIGIAFLLIAQYPNEVAKAYQPGGFSIITPTREYYWKDTLTLEVSSDRRLSIVEKYHWESPDGSFIRLDKSRALFVASRPGRQVRISCSLLKRGKVPEKQELTVMAFSQEIILKADDLVKEEHGFSSRWQSYFDLLEQYNIKSSVGIIGSSLEGDVAVYAKRIQQLHESGRVEFWNHGYSHTLNVKNLKGEKYCEFANTSAEEQMNSLRKTQQLFKEKTGLSLYGFGAPGNAVDTQTILALQEVKEIKYWFFGLENSNKAILKRTSIEIEHPVHHPNYNQFLQGYSSTPALLVLQVHPNSWDEKKQKEFKKIIEHLQSQPVRFILPRETLAYLGAAETDSSL